MSSIGMFAGVLTSGLVAATFGVVVTLGLSQMMPFPWDLSRTLVCVGIASFSGAAVGFLGGLRLAGRPDAD
jgi:hypothetical protein